MNYFRQYNIYKRTDFERTVFYDWTHRKYYKLITYVDRYNASAEFQWQKYFNEETIIVKIHCDFEQYRSLPISVILSYKFASKH